MNPEAQGNKRLTRLHHPSIIHKPFSSICVTATCWKSYEEETNADIAKYEADTYVVPPENER